MKTRTLALRLALAAVLAGGALFAAPAVLLVAQGAQPDLEPTCTVKCPNGECTCYAESCVCSCTWTLQPSCKPK